MIKLNNKKYVLTMILLLVFLLTGCNKVRLEVINDNTEPDTNVDTLRNKQDVDPDNNTFDIKMDDNSFDQDEELKPTGIKPADNIELLIYTVNGEAEIEAVIALIPNGTEITPQLIVDKSINSMADNSIIVGIENVTTIDDKIIVSFYSDQPPIVNVGAGMETSILNALAQSLIDNLDKYSKVIYQMEGKEYKSGHIELGLNEVYFEDKSGAN